MSMFTDMIMKKRRSSSSGHPEMELTAAGEIICVPTSGWQHTKTNDGFAISAMYIVNNYTSPIVISTVQTAATVTAKYSTGYVIGPETPTITIQYNAATYYVYVGRTIQFNLSLKNNPNITKLIWINDITGIESYSNGLYAAMDILDYYYGVI